MQRQRDASDRVAEGEPVRVDAAVLADFRDVFAARRRTFLLKLTSKPALSAVSALGAVGALFLGGWLVLRGRGDVGTVVASLSGARSLRAA